MSETTTTLTGVAERFWGKVERRSGDECWIWMAGVSSHGYGVFHPAKGETVGAHRWALSHSLGRPLKSSEFACHHCDNPPCVNPAHLFIGSHEENMADMVSKGRSARGAKKVKTHRLLDWQVVALRHEAASGALVQELAQKYRVSEALVSMLCRGHRRAHLGGPITQRYQTSTRKASKNV